MKDKTTLDDGDTIIQFQGVNKWFGNFHVLKDINLNVAKGERIVICGPSGSGKSTLIRCINRLEEHQEGRVTVDGIELTDDVKNIDAIRSEVGMVFQSFNLFPHLSVIDNLVIGQHLVRKLPKLEAQEIAINYLKRVQIDDQADKFPGQLSGGQQQRVAIARSLCMKPKIMLFDEVTSEMGFAREVADRVMFMDEGQIIEENKPDNFFDKPESDRAKLFLSQILHQ